MKTWNSPVSGYPQRTVIYCACLSGLVTKWEKKAGEAVTFVDKVQFGKEGVLDIMVPVYNRTYRGTLFFNKPKSKAIGMFNFVTKKRSRFPAVSMDSKGKVFVSPCVCEMSAELFVCGYADGSVGVFDFSSLKLIYSIKEHKGRIYSCIRIRRNVACFSSHCGRISLIKFGREKSQCKTKVWVLPIEVAENNRRIWALHFDSKRGNILCAGYGDNRIYILDSQTLQLKRSFSIGGRRSVCCYKSLVVSNKYMWIASYGTSEGKILKVNHLNGKFAQKIGRDDSFKWIRLFAKLNDQEMIIARGSRKDLLVYNFETQKFHVLKIPGTTTNHGMVNAIQVVVDGNQPVLKILDEDFRLYDISIVTV